jgi:micrococcal nuclease
VVRTVDGDTIRVDRDGEEIDVRFIGLDTPETVAQDRPIECFGPEASSRTAGLVDGGEVWLEYDEASGLTDKYDRTLAFVWLNPDTMLNELLIEEGFAEEVTYTEGYAHQGDFRAAEARAREAGAGLWSACAGESG